MRILNRVKHPNLNKTKHALPTVITLLTIATAAVAQQITPVWFEHLNANQGVASSDLLPILRKNLNASENNDGTSLQVSFGKLLPYDATRLLLFVRENGINEGSATPADAALAALYPDRSLIWINAASGAPMGIAKVIGTQPIAITGQGGQLDFFNEYGLDEDGNIYYGHKNKIIRYAKTGTDTWASTPTCCWTEPTVGATDCSGNPLDDSTNGDGNQSIRWREFRVTGKGVNTVLFCGGGTWRAGCHPQQFLTTNGVDFFPVSRMNNRNESGVRGNYALGGQSSHVLKYGKDSTRPNLETAYTAHFPGTGYGARPQRYQTDPDNPEHTATQSYTPNDTVRIMWLDEVATNGIPKFVWEAAGKDGLPEDKFKDGWEYYDGNWCNILDTEASLDYIVSYSMPSWDNQYGQVDGTNWHRPGWIGVHRLDGSISPNSAWKMACTEADIANSDNGGVGNDWGYCGDVTIIPDKTAPADLDKATFYWVGGGYGFGVFTVQNIAASITAQPPTSITVNELDPITISGAVVSGTPNTYQWTKNNVALDGAKTNALDGSIYYPPTVLQGVKKPTLKIAQSRAADSGLYKLTIVNPLSGTTTSTDVNVTVIPDTNAPNVTSTASMGDVGIGYTTVDVQFDKTIDLGGSDPATDPGTARNIANYTFTSPAGVSVTQADVRKSGKAVRLSVSGLPATAGTTFTLKVQGVRNYTRTANTAILPPGQTVSGAVQNRITFTEDIGSPAVFGTTYTMASGEFEAEAGGVDIWGASDSFHYAYREVTGDFDVMAQIAQVTNPGNRSGIMLREGTFAGNAPDARFNYITWNPGNLLGFHVRQTIATEPVWANPLPGNNWFGFGPTPNVWIRLKRTGDVTSAYYATDGANWVDFGSTTNIISPALLGLATAANAGSVAGFTKYASYGTTVLRGKLSIGYVGTALTLSWTGAGVLETSTSVTTGWGTAPSQSNPQVVPTTGTARYFRLKE